MKRVPMNGTNFLPAGPMIPQTKSSIPPTYNSHRAWVLLGTGLIFTEAKNTIIEIAPIMISEKTRFSQV